MPHNHFRLMLAVPDNYIGTLSSSMFAGMMVGAVGWGTCSDLVGRSAAFNATLFFTALFGIIASFAFSFWSLCVLLFFLGTAVGVSCPSLIANPRLTLSSFPGLYAHRWHSASRAHAKRKTVLGYCPLCILLSRISRFSARRSLYSSWTFLFTKSTLPSIH